MTPETWDGLTNTNVMKYQVPFEHTALAMMATAWSVDGNSVVFAYLNGIAVFNAQTGALLHSWTAKQNYSFQTLALSADNKYLVTTSFFHPSNTSKAVDAHLNVFSLSSGQLVAQPASGPYTNLYWSPDGKYLAAGGVSEAGGQSVSWHLWNPTNWQIEHTYTAADFSWSPDGSQIALVKNGGVQIVKTAQDTIVRSFAGGNGFVGAISWQPHGNRLLVETLTDNARTSTLSLWNTQNGALLYTFTAYHGAFNNGEAWSSDGKYVLFSVFQKIDKKSGPPTMTPGVQEWYEVIWIAE
jgi:WD40 repeat protein